MANIINHHRCQHSFIFMYHKDITEYLEPFSAILAHFQIMRREFCVFCMEPLQHYEKSCTGMNVC